MNNRKPLPIWVCWILAVLILAACGSPELAENSTLDSSPDTQSPPTETAMPSPTAQPSATPTEKAMPSPTAQPSATPTEPAPAYQTYSVGEDLGYSLNVADLNRDTYPDIVVADSGRDVVMLLYNQGDGTFQEAVEIATGEDPWLVLGADLDGDSHTDLVVTHYTEDQSGRLSVLLSNGDGTFQTQVDYDTVENWFAFPVDLDGDMDLDLLIDDAMEDEDQGRVLGPKAWLNNGDGTFQEGFFFAFPNFADAHVADLNGDTYQDLVVRHYPDAKISVLFGIGDGSFGEPVTAEGTYGMHGFIVAELDGDAYPDLAWVNSAGLVSVLVNNGDGTFQDRFDYDAGGETFVIVAVDMDGDGSQDLVVGPTGSGMASLLTNNGDGAFELTQDYYFKGAWVSLFVVSDVDGDGNPDLVGWDDSSVYVFPLEYND